MDPTRPPFSSLLPELQKLVVEKYDYKSIGRLVRTSKEMKNMLENKSTRRSVIPKEDGHLVIRQHADLFLFMARNRSRRSRTITMDQMSLFRFEMLGFTHMSRGFFEDHVQGQLKVLAEKCRVVRIFASLEDEVLQEILRITRPERVEICQQQLDAEEPAFQGIPEIAVGCSSPNSPYLNGQKTVRLLNVHRLVDLDLVQSVRTEAIIAILQEWQSGARIDEGRRLVFQAPLFFIGMVEERTRIVSTVQGYHVEEHMIEQENLTVDFIRAVGDSSHALTLTFHGMTVSFHFH